MELIDLLLEMVERDASDLHLVTGMPPMLRVRGILEATRLHSDDATVLVGDEVNRLLDPHLSSKSRTALSDGCDIAQAITLNDGPARERGGNAVRFRTCVFRDRLGVSAALRMIPDSIPTLSQIFSQETEDKFRGLLELKKGLILVVGSTGNGKSTTIASMIDAINTERCERIFTIEDPIEYVHHSKKSVVSQREVGSDVDSFEQGGLTALRSDPDIVLISELQTPESVRIAVALAETGHLVFASMQANSVSETITRLLESFPENRDTMQRMFARSFRAVVAQILLPRAGGNGRVPVHEILLTNDEVRAMIQRGETDFTEAMSAGHSAGMCTMDDSVMTLYKSGGITRECALDHLNDQGNMGI